MSVRGGAGLGWAWWEQAKTDSIEIFESRGELHFLGSHFKDVPLSGILSEIIFCYSTHYTAMSEGNIHFLILCKIVSFLMANESYEEAFYM